MTLKGLLRKLMWLSLAVTLVAFGFVLGTAVLSTGASNTQTVTFIDNPAAESLPVVNAPAAQVGGGTVLSEMDQVFSGIYNRVSPSVVSILIYARARSSTLQPIGSGSGFVIDPSGYIITNFHVVEPAERIDVRFLDGTIVEAEVVGTDPDSDLAIIDVDVPPERLSPVTFANSDDLVIGQTVLAIGNPFSQDWTLTSGIISALNRTIEGLDGYSIGAVIQTDAAINPGNSGGPLLNLNGEVIGINSQIISRERANSGVGFAIPSNLVTRVIPELISSGTVNYSFLGIESAPNGVTLDLINAYSLPNNIQGVVVSRVTTGGPAERGGLLSATDNSVDIITAINGVPVTGFNMLIGYLSINTRPGDDVNLTVYRNGQFVTLDVKLDARP